MTSLRLNSKYYVIPNAVRDLLNGVLCLHLGILRRVQDEVTSTQFKELRHPEYNEGSPECGIVPAFGDPSLRSG
ncbi:hypothetical protein [Legionella bononiensis]|uniref:Uncharacterized protein n=2 Tax=Legionella bononiensis TaxID=2793102 RepID=A0ABS1W6Q9_9GAMM|nr:hypothetical protein [Legionella bononiensis]MBL7525048.1 hypothetical protein [Legionella bononiensis]